MKGVFNHDTNEFITAKHTFRCYKIPRFSFQSSGWQTKRVLGILRRYPIIVNHTEDNLYAVIDSNSLIGYVKPLQPGYVGCIRMFALLPPRCRAIVAEEVEKIINNLKSQICT